MAIAEAKEKMAASIPELAAETGTSRSLLYDLANRGALPGCRRLGRRFLVHRKTFLDWLSSGTGDDSHEGNNRDTK